MSNFLAIATVTATLQSVLTVTLNQDVAGAQAVVTRPDGKDNSGKPTVHIFLYLVKPNPALRNEDLPTRSSGGQLRRRPQAALDLHYLFTFVGDETTLVPQRLLGSLERTLYTQPLMDRTDIQNTITGKAFLAGSNLDQQVENVRFTPSSLSTEELSKIWSIFYQVPYCLSVAYQAEVVLIDADLTSSEGLPVLARNLYIEPFRQPRIDRVISQAGGQAPIVAGSTLVIEGSQLKSASMMVRIGGTLRTPTGVQNEQVTLPVPSDLAAGVQSLQIIEMLSIGTPPESLPAFESNVAAFVLRPAFTFGATSTTQINVNVTPLVRKGQRSVLLLDNVPGGPPASFSFLSNPEVAAADTASLKFDLTSVGSGDYFVRIQVDGAESVIDLDPASAHFGPKVTL
jgi:uncharacterized protein DUF4255